MTQFLGPTVVAVLEASFVLEEVARISLVRPHHRLPCGEESDKKHSLSPVFGNSTASCLSLASICL